MREEPYPGNARFSRFLDFSKFLKKEGAAPKRRDTESQVDISHRYGVISVRLGRSPKGDLENFLIEKLFKISTYRSMENRKLCVWDPTFFDIFWIF